jgi:hypothetical protein
MLTTESVFMDNYVQLYWVPNGVAQKESMLIFGEI